MTGKRVARAATAEATGLGAGILAAWGTGLFAKISDAVEQMTALGEAFEPGENRERYDQLYREVYEPLFPAVQPLLLRLANF